ncbi:unnamed protein product [Leuciscus chuanchicus]
MDQSYQFLMKTMQHPAEALCSCVMHSSWGHWVARHLTSRTWNPTPIFAQNFRHHNDVSSDIQRLRDGVCPRRRPPSAASEIKASQIYEHAEKWMANSIKCIIPPAELLSAGLCRRLMHCFSSERSISLWSRNRRIESVSRGSDEGLSFSPVDRQHSH